MKQWSLILMIVILLSGCSPGRGIRAGGPNAAGVGIRAGGPNEEHDFYLSNPRNSEIALIREWTYSSLFQIWSVSPVGYPTYPKWTYLDLGTVQKGRIRENLRVEKLLKPGALPKGEILVIALTYRSTLSGGWLYDQYWFKWNGEYFVNIPVEEITHPERQDTRRAPRPRK